MNLPKISVKTSVTYLIIILLFGGRSVFPKIARQVFPDWQKVSIENVVNEVENGLQDRPKMATISLNSVVLERDAKLMLWENVLDLFVSKDISRDYKLKYNQDLNEVVATRKI